MINENYPNGHGGGEDGVALWLPRYTDIPFQSIAVLFPSVSKRSPVLNILITINEFSV